MIDCNAPSVELAIPKARSIQHPGQDASGTRQPFALKSRRSALRSAPVHMAAWYQGGCGNSSSALDMISLDGVQTIKGVISLTVGILIDKSYVSAKFTCFDVKVASGAQSN